MKIINHYSPAINKITKLFEKDSDAEKFSENTPLENSDTLNDIDESQIETKEK